MQDLGAEGTPRWDSARLGPVDASEAAAVMAAKGVFTVVDDDTGVQEADAEGPDDAGEATRREKVVGVDDNFGLGEGGASGRLRGSGGWHREWGVVSGWFVGWLVGAGEGLERGGLCTAC